LYLETLTQIVSLMQQYTLPQLALSFNGGKDCTVLMHLMRAGMATLNTSLSAIDVVYFENKSTHQEYEEIQSFMTESSDTHDFTIQHLAGSFKQGCETYIKQRKDAVVESDLKVSSSDPAKLAVFMGQRRCDPHGGQLSIVTPTSPGWPVFDRINPILEWGYKDVWDFLRRYELSYCSLYDKGFTSLGSKHNTKPNPKLKQVDQEGFKPAYELSQDTFERCGRAS
jgi:FAD synthetase